MLHVLAATATATVADPCLNASTGGVPAARISKHRNHTCDSVTWRELSQHIGTTTAAQKACASGTSSFATFISGSNYVPGAVCLRRSLQRAGNQCPIYLVYDDRAPKLNLTGPARKLLSSTFGADRLIPLSRLMALHPKSATDMRYSLLERSITPGRRLFHQGVEHLATHSKLWLWALPHERVVVLDADMVVRQPIDWLTTLPFSGQVAAVDISNRNSDTPHFNSGLMVIRPGAEHVRNLTHLARRATKEASVPKANEKTFGDQSILNWNFRNGWFALPPSLVQVVHPKLQANVEELVHSDEHAVLHWVGEPKPWTHKAGLRIGAQQGAAAAGGRGPKSQAELWWRLCSRHMQGVRREWLG